jgi:IS1 family transposase
VWTWTAINAGTKLIVAFNVGGRSGEYAMELMDDLRSRLANRVQLITDGRHDRDSVQLHEYPADR